MSIQGLRTVIGYFAYTSRMDVFCDGEACVIAGSKQAIKEYIAHNSSPQDSSYITKKTRFGEIMRGVNFGAAYCFNQEVYNRFYPLAQKTDFPLRKWKIPLRKWKIG
ncbi:MAG: hypothetical protein HY920_05810 [Elusimicrobia bacterium]|nr:hypothetical protein [Elusimicrobiota bacterium]